MPLIATNILKMSIGGGFNRLVKLFKYFDEKNENLPHFSTEKVFQLLINFSA